MSDGCQKPNQLIILHEKLIFDVIFEIGVDLTSQIWKFMVLAIMGKTGHGHQRCGRISANTTKLDFKHLYFVL